MGQLMSSKTPIYPLKICGKGSVLMTRKRMIDLGKSVYSDVDSSRPSSAGTFKELLSQMQIVKELGFNLPYGLR